MFPSCPHSGGGDLALCLPIHSLPAIGGKWAALMGFNPSMILVQGFKPEKNEALEVSNNPLTQLLNNNHC